MIPHTPNIPGKVPSEHFFLVEKPGLGVAIIAGVEDAIHEDNTGEVE